MSSLFFVNHCVLKSKIFQKLLQKEFATINNRHFFCQLCKHLLKIKKSSTSNESNSAPHISYTFRNYQNSLHTCNQLSNSKH